MRVILDSRRNLKVGVNSLIEAVKKVKGVKLSVDFERGWRRVEVRRPRKVKEKSSIG